jgi:hypothetical protein
MGFVLSSGIAAGITGEIWAYFLRRNKNAAVQLIQWRISWCPLLRAFMVRLLPMAALI